MEEGFYSHRRSNLTFLFLLVISIFFITANLGDYVQAAKRLLFYVLVPSAENTSMVMQSTSKLSNNFKDVITAHQENIVLKKEMRRYAQLENEWLKTKEENTRLKNLVGFLPPRGSKTIAAKVISREAGSWFQWVIIDRGIRDGVSVDLPVLAWSGGEFCVLGRTAEVFDKYSKIILITNSISSFPVMLEQSDEDGLLEGQNDYMLKLNYLIPSETIKIGDKVVTSPLSSVWPPKMSVGTVADFAVSDDERFRSVMIKPSLDFSSLREVVVVAPNKK